MCRCCAIVDRLNELWDRTHNSVLSVNGVYADGNGNVFIQGIQDISDLREEVQALEERVTNDRTYLEAVAEDVAEIGTIIPGLATLNTEQTFTAAKYLSVIGNGNYAMINKEWVKQTDENADNGLLHRTGNESKIGILTLIHNSYAVNSSGTWSSGANFTGNGFTMRDTTGKELVTLFPGVENGKGVLRWKRVNNSGSYDYGYVVQ